MKKFKYFAFALVAALACGYLWSCSDDDDDNGFSEKNLIGEWEGDTMISYCLIDGDLNDGSKREQDCDYRIEFDDDGYGYFYSDYSYYDYKFQWKISDGELKIRSNYSGEFDGTWTIKTLNASTLVLEQIDSERSSGYSHYDYTKITFRKCSYDDDDWDSGSYDDDDWDW